MTELSSHIKEWRGLYLPKHERHLLEWMHKVNVVIDGKPAYQYHKLEAALRFVTNWRTAVDVGAHCGLWSMHLAKRFRLLWAFEPVPLHRECFDLNVTEDNVLLVPNALGDKAGVVGMHTSDGSSGDSWVIESPKDEQVGVRVEIKRLDDYDLQDVDFIKLDCEGYEYYALKGAEETLKRCRPVVVVEQKPGRAQKWGLHETEAVRYLESLGAATRTIISGDYIMTWS